MERNVGWASGTAKRKVGEIQDKIEGWVLADGSYDNVSDFYGTYGGTMLS